MSVTLNNEENSITGKPSSMAINNESDIERNRGQSHKADCRCCFCSGIGWMKGKHHSEEAKKKLSIARMGKAPWSKGKHLSDETKRKISLSHIGNNWTKRPEVRKKISIAMQQLWNDSNYRKKIIEAVRGKSGCPTHKKSCQCYFCNPNKNPYLFKKGQTPWNKGKNDYLSPEVRQRVINAHRGKIPWNKGKHHSETTIKKILEKLFSRPTSLESKWSRIFKRHSLPYQYVGNGSFIIGSKNPDFINTDGRKICIEVRSRKPTRLWSKMIPNEYESKRIEYFKQYGWDCIVIWDTWDDKQIAYVLGSLTITSFGEMDTTYSQP